MSAKNITYAQALEEIMEYFGYNKDIALAWYMSPNDDLDGLSPYEMIKQGNGQRLMRIIRNSLLSTYSK